MPTTRCRTRGCVFTRSTSTASSRRARTSSRSSRGSASTCCDRRDGGVSSTSASRCRADPDERSAARGASRADRVGLVRLHAAARTAQPRRACRIGAARCLRLHTRRGRRSDRAHHRRQSAGVAARPTQARRRQPSPRTRPSAHTRELVARFFEASNSGDLEGLVQALASDVVLMSDGGGQVRAANRPLAAAASSAGSWSPCRRWTTSPAHGEFVELNGPPCRPDVRGWRAGERLPLRGVGGRHHRHLRRTKPDKLTRLAAPTASARSEEQAPSAESETLRAPPAEPKKKDSDAPTT